MCRDPAIMKRRDGRLEELEVDRVALDGLGPHERERLARPGRCAGQSAKKGVQGVTTSQPPRCMIASQAPRTKHVRRKRFVRFVAHARNRTLHVTFKRNRAAQCAR